MPEFQKQAVVNSWVSIQRLPPSEATFDGWLNQSPETWLEAQTSSRMFFCHWGKNKKNILGFLVFHFPSFVWWRLMFWRKKKKNPKTIKLTTLKLQQRGQLNRWGCTEQMRMFFCEWLITVFTIITKFSKKITDPDWDVSFLLNFSTH